MAADRPPVRPNDLESLFEPCSERAGRACALAVSGGSDSTALMVLFADWLRQRGAALAVHTVLTVDHGLRLQSAAEARSVAEQAAALGFRHAILTWEGAKPYSGIQAAARAARYQLMRDYMAAHDVATLFTAHTRDDQAETLLMRLARGSGLDGLAAIAPSIEIATDARARTMQIVRPLLGVPKARLRATLEERGIPWIEDPSNQSPAFERTRWRAARSDLEALGLSGDMLALSAQRLHRARVALDALTDAYCKAAEGLVDADRCGVFRIDRQKLRHVPEEIAVRLIGRCIAAAGGSDEPVPLGKLEAIVAELRQVDPQGLTSRTLARAQVTASGESVQIEREPGRVPLPVMTIAGPTRLLWDGRFVVEVAQVLEGSLEVRALAGAGLAELKRLGRLVKGASALLFVPSFWRGQDLVAVPAIDYWAREGLDALISANFRGLRYNSSEFDAGGRSDCDAS